MKSKKANKLIRLVLAAAILTTQLSMLAPDSFAAPKLPSAADVWDGTSADTSWYTDDPDKSTYEITTAAQLAGMANLSNNMDDPAKSISFKDKTIKLMNDIDLGGHEWTSIGTKGYTGGWGAFEGTFDGQNHAIKNLFCQEKKQSKTGSGHGLFHTIRYGTVKNLGIENADIYIPYEDHTTQAGILVDWCMGGQIYNCYTTGKLVSDGEYGTYGIGGIVGFSTTGTKITGCYSSASIQRHFSDVEVDFEYVGGIVGSWENSWNDARITDCYFNGEIVCNDDDSYIGGIIGLVSTPYTPPSLLIENCFVKPAAVSLDAPETFCYIAIIDENVTLRNCYYTEPDSLSGDESAYSPALLYNSSTGEINPDNPPHVNYLSDMKNSDFLDSLNRNASQDPPVTWIMGQEHPIFSWDLKNKPPVLSMTATASDALKANVSAVSDQDGTLYYLITDRNTPAPSDTGKLEQMAENKEGIAAGSHSVLAGKIISLTITGLEELTEYTVYAAVKNKNEIWSSITSSDFKTTRLQLTGAVLISGFPVAGEELTAEVVGIQEDAEPVFTWYRDKTKIDGADSDTYLLSGDDIGHTLHAEITSPFYPGTLKSVSTPEIAEEYTVDKIKVTRKPDKMTYQTGETFDGTGMEVKAYLKASASNATPSTAQKLLTESEYDTDYDFSKAGKAVVTISYMDRSTSLEVAVMDKALTGEITLTGRPVAGEQITSVLSGTPADAVFTYSWYRDQIRIPDASGNSYLLTDTDVGHRIHAEASAAGYAGTLKSLPTDTIQKSRGSSNGGSSSSGKRVSAITTQAGNWEQRADGTWAFKKENGTYASNEWLYIRNQDRNEWFRFYENGSLVSGWYVDSNGVWYYLSVDHDGSFGAMKTGWILGNDGYWYYLNPSNGAMMTGWQTIGGKWYYLNPTIYGQTWIPDQNGGWIWSGSTLLPYGAMYADTVTPDGFRVGADGARVE